MSCRQGEQETRSVAGKGMASNLRMADNGNERQGLQQEVK